MITFVKHQYELIPKIHFYEATPKVKNVVLGAFVLWRKRSLPAQNPIQSANQELRHLFRWAYPNPSDGNRLHIKYRLEANAPASVSVYGISGNLLGTVVMPFEDNTLESHFTLDLGKFGLAQGVNIIKLQSSKEQYNKRFIIIK
ncbi:MAG: T9SS type A sorting domain-containing protein [Edaphocola sp.]